MLVRDVMRRDVVTVSPNATVSDVAGLMAKEDVGAVVVMDEDLPIGIVTDRDLVLRHLALGHRGDCRIEEAMTPDRISLGLVTVGPQEDAMAAAERIGEEGVRRLLVMEEGKLAGILSASDLIARFRDAIDGLLAEAGKDAH